MDSSLSAMDTLSSVVPNTYPDPTTANTQPPIVTFPPEEKEENVLTNNNNDNNANNLTVRSTDEGMSLPPAPIPVVLPPSSSSWSWFPSSLFSWVRSPFTKLGYNLRYKTSQEIILNPAGSSLVPITSGETVNDDERTHNSPSNFPRVVQTSTIVNSNLPTSSSESTTTDNNNYPLSSSSLPFTMIRQSNVYPTYTQNPTSFQQSSKGEVHSRPFSSFSSSSPYSPAVYDAFSRSSSALTNAFVHRQQYQDQSSSNFSSAGEYSNRPYFGRFRDCFRGSLNNTEQPTGESSNSGFRNSNSNLPPLQFPLQPSNVSYTTGPPRFPSSSPICYPEPSTVPVLPPSESNFSLDKDKNSFTVGAVVTGDGGSRLPSSSMMEENNRTTTTTFIPFPSSNNRYNRRTTISAPPPSSSVPPKKGKRVVVPYDGPPLMSSNLSGPPYFRPDRSYPPSSAHQHRTFYRYGSGGKHNNNSGYGSSQTPNRPFPPSGKNRWNKVPGMDGSSDGKKRFFTPFSQRNTNTVQPTIIRHPPYENPYRYDDASNRNGDIYRRHRSASAAINVDSSSSSSSLVLPPNPKTKIGQIYDKEIIDKQNAMDIER